MESAQDKARVAEEERKGLAETKQRLAKELDSSKEAERKQTEKASAATLQTEKQGWELEKLKKNVSELGEANAKLARENHALARASELLKKYV